MGTSFAGAPVVNLPSATVFGATGFLGRYLVQQLAKMGSQVLVPFRGSEDNPRHLKLMGDLGQIVPMKYDPRDENSIKAVIAKANVVINLIGREYETRNFNFEEVNHFMAEQLAVHEFRSILLYGLNVIPVPVLDKGVGFEVEENELFRTFQERRVGYACYFRLYRMGL
ncbi:hypothetical protein ERO13_A13G077301v2 [Gossypium hirsutum]|nr:hypothetical protein ERO13_A13G077301v2 [Gossypium hirsutum]